jgi:quinoprotein glucose dehydrogenase
MRIRFPGHSTLAGLLCLAACAPLSLGPAPPGPESGGAATEWTAFGADAGGSRHSPAEQIRPDNVQRLELAWVYRTGDYRLGKRGGRFEATSLMVDGTLYVSTPFGRAVALNPMTGEELWNYDPRIDLAGGYGDWANRGVATWMDPARIEGEACRRRIFVAPVDARLIALDARSGLPCADFGEGGTVNLKHDLLNEPLNHGEYQVTSPPAIIGNLVVIGSAVADNQRVDAPSGVVRAFDARSGALIWRWDPIPRDPGKRIPGAWEGSSAERTGAANAWAPISVDESRDLIFVPVGSPSPDYYGGERPGRNDYANSIVALRGTSGEVVWHFQAVHHDL